MFKREKWSCPKCDEGKIEVDVRPKVLSQRDTYYGKEIKATQEEFFVLNDCSECGAKVEELERLFKKKDDEPKMTRDQIRDRILALQEEMKKS